LLPTFVIGLREGVEAALIVGIVAAFINKEGERSQLRHVWVGVGIAALICIGIGVGLDLLNEELPQRQQEMMETVIGLAAVGIVTFMIFWMRRHARMIKSELHESASAALNSGSAWALIGMAFFAVLREGIETAVFLLAVFQNATDPTAAGIGAALGILCAVVIGFGIYRGGVRLDLAKFFKFTAVVLVFVAAGLLASAAHTAWEAGWITSFQDQAVDLSWLVVPGTWTSSLLTGMLGLQTIMTQAEVFAYLVYLIPMLAYVLWPQGRRLGARSRRAAPGGANAPGAADARDPLTKAP